MSEKTKQKKHFKHKLHSDTQHAKVSKVLYNKKFVTPMKKKRKTVYDPEEEARLERIVFGDSSDIVNHLLKDKAVTKNDELVVTCDENVTSEKDIESNHDETVVSNIEESHSTKKAVWEDDDDYNYTVDTALNMQNRTLPCKRPEKLYTTYLQNRYKLFVGTPEWAKPKNTDKVDDSDSDILKHSCHLEVPTVKNLPKNLINIKALTALNKSTHTEGTIVTSIEFHPSSTVALVAGTSGILSLFQVDGHTNRKLYSMQFKKFPISKATFIKEATEVLVGSQYHAHCHTYNLMNGKEYKFPLPHGITNMKCYEVSPDGKIIALCGRGGEIYLLLSSTKECISTLKMNSKCKTLAFTPDSKTLITHGDGGEMYIWDMNTRTCIHRAVDDGCLSCISLAVSPSGQFVATGSAQGVVNLYDTKSILEKHRPTPLKIMMNLVTEITCLKFNSTSEILGASSNQKYNAFKMMHLPSFTVFPNFPTFNNKIGMPQTISFSPGSGYLSVSNKTGTALLFRLKHYENY